MSAEPITGAPVGRLTLFWRRHVIGGLHDHEEGDERADCPGCRYEDEVLWPPPSGSSYTRVSGPAQTSSGRPDDERPDGEHAAPEPAADRRRTEDASPGAAHR